MHSWEIVQQKTSSVLIAVVAPPGGISVDWALSWGNMQKPPIWDVMRLSGLPWDIARTQAAIQCLNGGYQFLFMLDADICAPKDTITRLISHRLPIVSGLYHQRFPTWSGVTADYMPCMFNEVAGADGKLAKQVIADYKPGSLVEAAYVPGGCLLIHRSVFERMTQAGIKRFFEWTLQVDAEPPGSGRCVPIGEEIFGGSPIETVEAGETIWDYLGRRSQVKSTFSKKYEGDIVTITPKCLKIPFRVTPEHQILAMERPVCPYNKRVLCRVHKRCWVNGDRCENPVWLDNKPRWVAASDLKLGMYLAFPKIDGHSVRHRIDLALELDDYIKHCDDGLAYFKGAHKPIRRFLEITPEFLELLGLYVAEGYASTKSNIISLSFGLHELKLAEEVVGKFEASFGIKPWIAKGDHAWNVNIKRKPLAILFLRWFGKGARNKKIPDWILSLPSREIGYFLKGLWKGDGSQGYTSVNKRHSFWLNTSSKTLALQVAALLIKCGIHVGVFEYRAEKAYNHGATMYRVTIYGGSPKFGRLIHFSKRDRHERKKDINHGFFYDKKYWFPIGKVERQPYTGQVYDLTVEPNNSYILGLAIVHNSEDFEFCAKARSIGFKCFVDTSIIATHETGAQVGVKGLLPKL